jgi:hypothetical protein|eukprot:COSAG01_NODE_1226_length_11140_cov_73.834798_6_plen_44_part_00
MSLPAPLLHSRACSGAATLRSSANHEACGARFIRLRGTVVACA